MSELLAFGTLGFRHITDPRGADHILFLLALAAIYRFRDWRECVWVVTAFTVGHSATLALAVTEVLVLPSAVTEFLIPLTIAATALENVVAADLSTRLGGPRYRPVFAGVFGLVHGAGFANYLRSLFIEHIAVPLLGFNVGLEVGQIIVLALAFAAFTALDRLIAMLVAVLSRSRSAASAGTRGLRVTDADRVIRMRTLAVSVLVMSVAARWMLERIPW